MREFDQDELIDRRTLVGKEPGLVATKRGAAKIAFALMLRFYTETGRFPRGRSEIHDDAVEYLARQIGVSRSEIAFYDFTGRTSKTHRAQIRESLGFRECSVAERGSEEHDECCFVPIRVGVSGQSEGEQGTDGEGYGGRAERDGYGGAAGEAFGAGGVQTESEYEQCHADVGRAGPGRGTRSHTSAPGRSVRRGCPRARPRSPVVAYRAARGHPARSRPRGPLPCRPTAAWSACWSRRPQRTDVIRRVWLR
ncbi:DUF4158 domain-containing protein [Nocardia brasiliensis]|uniref:DUF4158 domain-containing protein n=1 Tax=Nocardia brasiliensis TaxID=37326 RepID=UPI003D7B9004